MRVEDFDYELPEHLIAQHPLPERDQSRLLVVDPVDRVVSHRIFADIVDELHPGDVLVMNDSRVLPARLFAVKPDTGGRVELLLVKPDESQPNTWQCLARPAKRLRVGHRLVLGEGADRVELEIVGEEDEGIRLVRFLTDEAVTDVAHRFGEVPLPPYIHETLEDKERYQTVYAKREGSVAAPTAGLHFTDRLLQRLREKGVQLCHVTLHVGIGTFRPVQVENVEEHRMHSEWYEVSPETAEIVNRAKAEGRPVIAVGTTALRTLEAAGQTGVLEAKQGETDIFIYPGFQFRIMDGLITNFHLPKSTLFMLVCAIMGTDYAKAVYREAVEREYRFFSFGDAMFIKRRADVAGTGQV
ncbi:tRNA preQ1(34) S-adenosylmethionine ribosyltransferase-isomerase QueA [Alicyclobacillus vulcanalis]|uniref:S-adenosylmethionine:tRNA ribosyltransferase-isomerase n=1 Tax=Alicyclobacillus vulcanalis TaxID=252246 RepID=A0A1N7P9E7_9BACL|nr:tRNA preQ1(34) S-adenosylmethionine ribosyltransferase-isomerase QueA [Alicyclobacillus vulcanalis]SIT07170.1 S-adenosylmethionine--tRNA ribosyltransferase-isomerase [Alicyclobacillus vulcanalis]